MNKLTAKQLLMINQKLVEKESIASNELIKKLDAISKIPYEQNEEFFYKYKNTIEKASKLGCAIARIKPFKEKNKQTAIFALLTLLELNGIKLIEYEDDIQELVSYLEENAFEKSCEWIRNHKLDEEMV